MALYEAVLSAYKAANFAAVPQSFVEETWETNFCETVALPGDLEEELVDVLAWRQVVDNTRQWRQEEETSRLGGQVSVFEDSLLYRSVAPVGFWTVLFDAGVSHKCLLSIVFALLDRSKSRIRDKLCASLASQLYFVLLQIPGTTAYKTFHPMIFQKALDSLLVYPESARVLPLRRGSKSAGGRKAKRKKSTREEEEELEMEEDIDDAVSLSSEQSEAFDDGTPRDRELLKQYLKEVVKELTNTLQSYSLKHHEVTRCQITTAMLRLTRLELPPSSSSAVMDLSHTPSDTVRSLPVHFMSWACLSELCTSRHGSLEKTLSEVFHQLLPVITMITDEDGIATTSTLPLSLVLPSQHTLTFIRHLSTRVDTSMAIPLRTLVQHVCVRTPDRAEYRSRLASIVTQLLSLFTNQDYSNMVDWLYRFSRNTKVPYRVFAVEVVGELMTQPLREVREEDREDLPAEAEFRLSYHFLVKMVLSRCSDRSPSVRAKAMSCLASVSGSHDNQQLVAAVKKAVFSLTERDPLLRTPLHPLTGDDSLVMNMLQRRTSDNKVAVRKSALQALEALSRLRRNGVLEEDVVAIHERCLDPALSVRKQAMISLTALTLENKQRQMIYRYWLDGVLPMVMDPEAGAKDKCVSILEEVLLRGVCEIEGEDAEFAWTLFNEIVREDKLDLRRCVRLALQQWSQAGKLSPAFISLLCANSVVDGRQQAAWMMLAEVSPFTKHISPKFVLDNWKKWVERDVVMTTDHVQIVVSLLTLVGNVSELLPRVAIPDFKDRLLSMLSTFQLPVMVISAATTTLTLLCVSLSPSQTQYQSTLDSWLVNLLHCCEQQVSSFVSQPQELNEEKLISYLFTLGEMAQLCPAHTSLHTGVLVQSLLVATSEAPNIGENVALSPEIAHYDNLHLTATLRAHTYVTLGKLCLQNEDLAKTSLVLLSRELEYSQHAVIRNNIVVVLCDLAVRYSAKVDPYIPCVSACLKDKSLLVRKQALTLLAHLLQDDYIKWKGSLFYQLLSTLIDEHLSKLTEFCLLQLLLARQPHMFYQHFVECVFYFNGYKKHRVFNQFSQSKREQELFSLGGPDNSSDRMFIYQFLLSHMTDEHRFQLTTKLCHEVLGGVVDGVIAMDTDATHLIKDTLAVLACKDIKLTSLRRTAQDEAAQEGDVLGVAMATAQTKIITQLVKKNALENIIPVVIATKHLFEKERSPLLKDLLMYLSELMKDFRTEIKDILTGEPHLADEIEFDLRKFEEEQQRAAQSHTPATTNTTTNATPHAQIVSPLLTPQALGASLGTVAGHIELTSPRLRNAPPTSNAPPSSTDDQDPGTAAPSSPTTHTQHDRQPMSPLVTADGAHNAEDFGMTTPVNHGLALPAAIVSKLRSRTPQIPLRRLAILTSARKILRPAAPLSSLPTPYPGVNTADASSGVPLRAASTPAGLADSISFNASSVVSSSPIPVTRSGTVRTRFQTKPGNEDANTCEHRADITMNLPDNDSSNSSTSKWNIQ